MESLLCGSSVVQAQIEMAIRDAAQRAGRARAELVLAFVGHGTPHGGIPKLFLMAGDSRRDEPTTGVNVGDLLVQALDTQGVQGVVALVDTCHAGGATPDLGALGAGIRWGTTRLSLLMSVGVNEDAYGLTFTRGLLRVLRRGVEGAGVYLSVETVRAAVNEATDTAARVVVANGDPFSELHPWIARNACHSRDEGPLLGPVGTEELKWALEPFGDELLSVPVSNTVDLEDLRQRLLGPRSGHTESPEDTTYALSVIDGLLSTIRTADLLRSWPGTPLTSARLRRAASAAGGGAACPPGPDGSDLLRNCVEFLRLRAPRADGSRREHLAAFIAGLAQEDGFGPDTPELSAWAQTTGAVIEFNDAFAALAEQERASRLRLVVSLHAALADEWPETLTAWLLDRGEQVAYKEFTCAPTQSGVEKELVTVLSWASGHAKRVGARLKRVEVAASAYLLVRWRPEETNLGARLGRTHDVVLRWSDRLCPPAYLSWINDYARDRLAAMSTYHDDSAPVDWLGKEETSSAEELIAHLEVGVYERAVALSHQPAQLDELMPALLAHAPIVLWPGDDEDLPAASRDSVNRYWNRLPGKFSDAYRDNWRAGAGQKDPHDGRPALARLRSVWHDTEWLDFCDWFETQATDGANTV
ncbi:vWA-MoxR associated conflict system protein [Streptomyces coeruleorubidus]|uniref:vWA-MoxR associated conflict system protein n=1 Tax=Streptomyces coeruleorubidus TaxID=116188 RepID=UPI0037A7A886